MPEYFVKTGEGGRAQGPFTAQQLQTLAAAGNLKPSYLLSKDKVHWTPADRAGNLTFGQIPLLDEDPESVAGPGEDESDTSDTKELPPVANGLYGTSCPSCGSSDTKRTSVIYEQGTQVGSIVGLGTGSGSLGVGGGIMRSRSLLASRLAPPKQPTIGCLPVLFLTAGASLVALLIFMASADTITQDETVGAFLLMAITLIAAAWAVVRFVQYRKERVTYPG